MSVGTSGDQSYRNDYYGISYAISDDLSLSYNRTESAKHANNQAVRSDQDWDSVSASYSMGGMTINVADSDCGNCSYTSGRSQSETTVSLTVAF